MKPAFQPERLIKIRESLGLNKSQAAAAMGLTPIGYLRYEQGLRTPSIQSIELLALTFGTSVAYLTGETKDPSADKIIVSKEANESLFELTKGLSDQDAAFVERMLAYYKKIKK